MYQPDPQVKKIVERAFGLPAAVWRPLAAGSINVLFVVESPEPVTVRFARHRSIVQVAEEVTLVDAIRQRGFTLVPQFLTADTGATALEIPDGYVVSCYRYVTGIVQQPLSESQFHALVAGIPTYLTAISAISTSQFPERQHLPTPQRAVTRARRLFERARVPSELQAYVYDATWPRLVWVNENVIHGDLHAKNFVWTPESRLASVIDFDMFWLGDILFELCALITGTCFEADGSIMLGRMKQILDGSSLALAKTQRDAKEIVESLIVTAMYFFGRVNRHLLDQGKEPSQDTIEWRDAIRATALVRQRAEIERIVTLVLRNVY
jgi:Ser/Thr protein kinase RdoA (MazF antagonist)